VATYRPAADECAVVVTARSSVHNVVIRWNALSGTVSASPGDLPKTTAELSLDMRLFDAGDALKNRKLRKDLAVDSHPKASFELLSVENIVGAENAPRATLRGRLSWRDRTLEIPAQASGTLTEDALAVSARFSFDMREFGVKPPRFLMLKVDETVEVEVQLRATSE